MTYNQIIQKLQSAHFCPQKVGKSGKSVSALKVNCPEILQKERTSRIVEVLGPGQVTVKFDKKEQVLVIKKA